jgi:antirestriction protein ArdC
MDKGFNSYAFEELVAELGAAMICTELGIPLDNLQHTEYIASWIKRLQDDTDFIFKAAAHASRAAEYLSASLENDHTEPLALAA